MFCTNCGANLTGDAKFCPRCGTKINNEEKPKKHMSKTGRNILIAIAILVCVFVIVTILFFTSVEVQRSMSP